MRYQAGLDGSGSPAGPEFLANGVRIVRRDQLVFADQACAAVGFGVSQRGLQMLFT